MSWLWALALPLALTTVGCASSEAETADDSPELNSDALRGGIPTRFFVGTWRSDEGFPVVRGTSSAARAPRLRLLDGSPGGVELQVYADNQYAITLYRCDHYGLHCAGLPLNEARTQATGLSEALRHGIGTRGTWRRALLKFGGPTSGDDTGARSAVARPLMLEPEGEAQYDLAEFPLFYRGENAQNRLQTELQFDPDGQEGASFVLTRVATTTAVLAND